MNKERRRIPGTSCSMDTESVFYTKTGKVKKADSGSYRIEGIKKRPEAWFNITFPELTEDLGTIIPDCPSYRITKDGRVYSDIKHKFLTVAITNSGYGDVKLVNAKGKPVHRLVHRLVAQAYIPNPENKSDVNHMDINKLNNNVDNLEWMTRRENCNHGLENGCLSDRSTSFTTTCVFTDKVTPYYSISHFLRENPDVSKRSMNYALAEDIEYKGLRFDRT